MVVALVHHHEIERHAKKLVCCLQGHSNLNKTKEHLYNCNQRVTVSTMYYIIY